MRSDSGFNILGEVRIDGRRGFGRHQSDTRRDRPPGWSGRTNHRKWLCVAFYHDFGSGLHTLQNGGEVTYCIGFADVQRLHGCHYTGWPHF